jgi:hypothetical protein
VAESMTSANINREIAADEVLEEVLPEGATVTLVEIQNNPVAPGEDIPVLVIIVGASAVGVLVVVLLLFCYCRKHNNRHPKYKRTHTGSPYVFPQKQYPQASVYHLIQQPRVSGSETTHIPRKILDYTMQNDMVFTPNTCNSISGQPQEDSDSIGYMAQVVDIDA